MSGAQAVETEDLDAEIVQAERDVNDAEDLASGLERRIAMGDDDVTAEEFAAQRSMARFASLRAEGLRAKIAEGKARKHRHACEALADEIDAASTESAADLAARLKTAQEAVASFLTAAGAREDRVRDWRERIHRLGVPKHTFPIPPPPEQGGLGHDGPTVVAGSRRLLPISADVWITRMLVEATQAAGVPSLTIENPAGSRVVLGADLSQDDPYAKLRDADQPIAEPDADLCFLRGSGGAVYAVDRKVLEAGGADNDYQRRIRAGEIALLTREEAWGQ